MFPLDPTRELLRDAGNSATLLTTYYHDVMNPREFSPWNVSYLVRRLPLLYPVVAIDLRG